jgi:hypothetical protein
MTAVPQYVPSIERPQSVRMARAALHRRVAALPRPAGCLRVAELLEDPPEVIATMDVGDLLRWVHKIGGSQSRGILMHADGFAPISEFRQIRQLTERQRHAVADHLRTAYESARPGAIPR